MRTASPRASPAEITELVISGSVLDSIDRCSREEQMKRHSEIIQQIYAEGSNCLENLVVDAKKIEEEWQYNDFEQKVFGALPALLR